MKVQGKRDKDLQKDMKEYIERLTHYKMTHKSAEE